jgi:ParB/RepB/Spo0J family partition protein
MVQATVNGNGTKTSSAIEMLEIEVGKISSGWNPRSDFSGVEEIAKSIEAIGLLHPIVVRRDASGAIIVIDGEQRLRALKVLGQKTTQVRVLKIDVSDGLEAQLAANLVRSDMNVLERARGYEAIIRKFPAKYNERTIAKKFGVSERTVKQLVAVAKKLSPVHDEAIGAYMGAWGIKDLELLASMPAEVVKRVLEACAKSKAVDMRVDQIVQRIAHRLDTSDFFGLEKVKAVAGAFPVRYDSGYVGWYTFDKVAYDTARKEYEAAQKKKYGTGEAKSEKAAAKVSEADKKKREAARVAQKKAQEALKGGIEKFVAGKYCDAQFSALGEFMCERQLNADKSRRILKAFGVKDEPKDYMGLQRHVWKKVFMPIVRTPAAMIRLAAFLAIDTFKDDKSIEQHWVEGMKK